MRACFLLLLVPVTLILMLRAPPNGISPSWMSALAVFLSLSLSVSLIRSLYAWQNFLIKIQIRNCAKVRIVVIITQHKTISTFCASRRCSPPLAAVFLPAWLPVPPCLHRHNTLPHTHTHTHPLNQTLTQAPANNKLRTIQPPKRTWAGRNHPPAATPTCPLPPSPGCFRVLFRWRRPPVT